MVQCKKCKATIVWVETDSGRWMPCSEGQVEYKVENSPKLNKDTVVNDRGEVIKCNLDFEGDPTGSARLPHWVTCPFADEFRNRRSG